ncbi:MAG TPA: Pvc16 family protein [Blastocatellia bacterium]|nr:Pvc16 family protein [Blastocatellia bacterium]
MSYLAIGAVTKAIAELLEKKMNKPPLLGVGAVFKVTTVPPDDTRVDQENGINLFLYRLTESPFAKNSDWPGDRANPVAIKRPPIALNLHYLLTAYAKKSAGAARDDIAAHQLLGNALAILHQYPVLNDIHDADFDADLDSQFPPELRNSFDKLRINLSPISMEEFSKIWTGLSKAYRLSVAYEVSLVQIAPLVLPPNPAPPLQQASLQLGTIEAPLITALEPADGAAGARVVIQGKGLKARGGPTLVTVGGIQLSEADLLKLSANAIELNIPAAPLLGPRLRVVVKAGGLESPPAFYEVRPWIDAIQPLRGATGVPLTIPFDAPAGATIGVEIAGQAATTTLDPANGLVRAIVPGAITTNGLKPVVLIINGGSPQRSNARFYEVLPVIQSVNLTTVVTPAKTTITVNGARLSGSEVSVRYGKLLLSVGNDPGDAVSNAQVVVNVARLLPANQRVSVLVDGRESNVIPPQLESLDPPAAFAGDTVALSGEGLSGQNVVVHFGATDVTITGQPFMNRFSLEVPATLAAGTVPVTVTVDGNTTNAVSFEVLG